MTKTTTMMNGHLQHGDVGLAIFRRLLQMSFGVGEETHFALERSDARF
jgi:hypothetical protein